jgi:hypothetical protein
MKKLLVIVCCLALWDGVVFGVSACSHNPPVLTPTAAAALTNGLGALSMVLRSQNVNPLALAAISDAQTAIAQDVTGHSWGEIVRTLLTELYSQLPPEVLNRPAVWASFAAIEIVLATIGA